MPTGTDPTDAALANSSDLTRAGIRHAISGALAMAAHGYVRATLDIDLLVVTPALRLPEVFAIARRHGFDGDDRALIQEIRERYATAMRSDRARVEFFVPVLPYHATLVDRANLVEIQGVTVPVVSREDLIVLKLLGFRSKDVPDIERLIVSARGRVDIDYVRRTLASILPADHPRHAALNEILGRTMPPPRPD